MTTVPLPTRVSLLRALLAGLVGGSAAALGASLVSLPLTSPDDAFFNTATVTAGALLAGLLTGLVWWLAGAGPSPVRAFGAVMVLGFVAVSAAALVVERLPDAPLDGLDAFVVPLAAVVFALAGLVTPAAASRTFPAVWVAVPGVVGAAAVGLVFAGHGDAAGGGLTLPKAQASQPGGLIRREDVEGVAFDVVPGESEATYTVREKLARLPAPNDAVGRTTDVTGTIYLDGRSSLLRVDLRTLESDQARRDDYVRNRSGVVTAEQPYAEFTVDDLSELPTEYREGETYSGTVSGTLKIAGVERRTTFAVEARLEGGTLYIHGTTDFTWADFQIRPPNIAGMVEVEDTVHVEVLVVARHEAGEG